MTVLTQDDVTKYEQDGFVLVKKMFDSERLKEIVDWLTLLAEQRGQLKRGSPAFVLEDVGGVQINHPLEAVRKIGNLHFMQDSQLFFGAESKPALAASELMKTKALRMLHCFSFAKPALHGSEVPWHQDQMLWSNWTPSAATCWAAVDECTIENGCLQFVRGSHLNGVVEHVKQPGIGQPFIPKDAVDREKVVHMLMEPGDAVFFHPFTWHFSEPNRSTSRRLSFSAVYSPESEYQYSKANTDWRTGRIQLNLSVGEGEKRKDLPFIQV